MYNVTRGLVNSTVRHMKTEQTLVIFTLLVPLSALATPPYFCSSNKVTDCLHITRTQCEQAVEKAFELCSDHYDIDSKEIEEARIIMKDVIMCSTKQFSLLASLDEKDLNACVPEFKEAERIEVDRLKNMQKEYEPTKIY